MSNPHEDMRSAVAPQAQSQFRRAPLKTPRFLPSSLYSRTALPLPIPLYSMAPHSMAEAAASPTIGEARAGADKKAERANATHLVVLQHGLLGSESDLEHLERLLTLHLHTDGVYVHCGQSNAEKFFQTCDGVDQGGERLANEIQALATEMPSLRRFSMVGHSLGGLYNRYCIGVLYARGFFKDIEPVNFVTLATPHLGIRRPHRGSFNFIWNVVSPKVLSRTGQQLHLIDEPTDLSLALSKPADIYPGKTGSPAWTDMKGKLLVAKGDEHEQLFQQYFCVLDGGKLRVFDCDEYAESGSVDSIRSKFEVDLTHAHVTLSLPTEEHLSSGRRPRSRGGSFSSIFSFGHATESSRGSDAREHRNFDVRIECPGGSADSYTLRISENSLLRDWRWIVALSNTCHGMDCKTSGSSTQDDVQKTHPPALLSCMTRGQFMQALQMFKVRSLYANVFFDLQVPYSGASIRAYNPYRVDLDPIVTSPAYRHITLASVHNATALRDTTPKILKELTHNYALSMRQLSSGSSPPSSSRSAGDVREDHRHSIGSQGKSTSVPSSMATPPASAGSIWPSHRRNTSDSTNPRSPPSTSGAESETARPEPFVAGDVIVDQVWHAYASDPEQDVLRGMLLSIQSVGWRRMETLFSSALAHEKIIAKRAKPAKPLDSGLDVAHHVVDTFVL